MSEIVEQPDQITQLFQVQVELFDGPIDLLLHLVKQRELPIEKLSLAQVTSQYLACIQDVRGLDLETAGEYMVIAATLVSIKSSVVLNEPVQFVVDADGNLVDPHEELLQRLREAEIYREGAKVLATKDLLGVDVFAANPVVLPGEEPEVILKNHDVMLLGKAMLKVLQQPGLSEALMTINFDSVTIVERMVTVLDRLKLGAEPVSFKDLMDVKDRAGMVGTFLALLELCKRQVINVRQNEVFDEIFVTLATADVDASSFAAEYQISSVHANG